jgi:hypothetical protein
MLVLQVDKVVTILLGGKGNATIIMAARWLLSWITPHTELSTDSTAEIEGKTAALTKWREVN